MTLMLSVSSWLYAVVIRCRYTLFSQNRWEAGGGACYDVIMIACERERRFSSCHLRNIKVLILFSLYQMIRRRYYITENFCSPFRVAILDL